MAEPFLGCEAASQRLASWSRKVDMLLMRRIMEDRADHQSVSVLDAEGKVSPFRSSPTTDENKICERHRPTCLWILEEPVKAANLIPQERVQMDRRAIVPVTLSQLFREVSKSPGLSCRSVGLMGFVNRSCGSVRWTDEQL